MRTLVVARSDSPACALAQRLIDSAALKVLDHAHTATEALTMALAMQPELLLLDPGLKPVAAAELAASLHDPAPQIVWLTHDIVRRCLAADGPQRVNDALKRLPRRRLGVEVRHLIVLEHGRVAESGTHEQLLSANGAYARLYQAHRAALLGEGEDGGDGGNGEGP